ncbi:hypothetical protein EXIGLDRAFT_834465 [Exidia glandulosa HHB12029]|uniref:F-box domain-containing protein n=1 Tax=Exidia glandulosa HHB12029 TaxID=1314781 RepID=A0A165JQU3_EXIGL|nr:hypothetical protein EXIGLDRAFT_834465 [Exidia glandulosa HHB12029]
MRDHVTVLVALFPLLACAQAPYRLSNSFTGSAFLDAFTFDDTESDLRSSSDWLANASYARSAGLAAITNTGNVRLKVDNTSTVVFNDKRASVSITSRETVSLGSLIVLDVRHGPCGCSLWPAFSSRADTWPVGGGLNIFKSRNVEQNSTVTLSLDPSSSHCVLQPDVTISGSLVSGLENCSDATTECAITRFDGKNQTGVWVTELAASAISVWYFPVDQSVPEVLDPAIEEVADTAALGRPLARFAFPSATDECDLAKLIAPQRLVLSISLCGLYADFNNPTDAVCGGSCYSSWVLGAGSPTYDNAYFDIASLRIYTSPTSAIAPNTNTSTPWIVLGEGVSPRFVVIVLAGSLGGLLLAFGLVTGSAEVRACFEGAVAAELHEHHNAERMRSLRLPDELWVGIWAHLPMRSVVSVSHVCRIWRSMALASPSLWATLEVFGRRHPTDCKCQPCVAVATWVIYCKSCRSDAVTLGNANTELIRHLLPRSDFCPLSLVMDIEHNTGVDETRQIAEMLAPHCQRIVHIDWRGHYRNVSNVAEFFRPFDELPALRTLSSISAAVKFSRNIRLPSLRQLQVTGTIYGDQYDFDSGRLVFPSVTRLDYTIPFHHHDSLISTLEAVPNLTVLHLCGEEYYNDPISLDYDRITQLTAHLDDVHIRYFLPNMYRLAMALYTTRRHTFALELFGDVPRSALFHHIFTDLRDDVRLSILGKLLCDTEMHEKVWNVDGVDSQGRHRRITHHPEHWIYLLWVHLPLSTLSVLYIDADLMRVIPRTIVEFPTLHELTVNAVNADSLAFADDGVLPHIPALRVLRLAASASVTVDGSASLVSIPTAHVASFISKASVDGGILSELVLDNVELGGDLTALKTLVGSCR